MTSAWAPIQYRDFHDFPRAFVVERDGDLLLFDCPFSDAADGYAGEFEVFRIRKELEDRVGQLSWNELRDYGDRIGAVPVDTVIFDKTRRKAIDTRVFELLDREASVSKRPLTDENAPAVIPLASHESLVTGQWLPVDGHVAADPTCARILGLIRSYLVEVSRDSSGWNTLYQDPADQRLWELTYPQSHLHGGGPPQLRHLTLGEARTKYGRP